ncbi:MAG: nickel pincer cofactor biosynthesis protein LarB [Coriobacteriaceae bacterium]|jgi:NCAIR mutase (PurE)-related protein|nr:nickel pincer cofactor biosynthesis protein LarB [Coriobacteriaceae bacterium]
MELLELEVLINAVAEGSVAPDEALSRLRSAPFTDLGYAKIDNHRGIRQGVAEVIYGEGKTAEHIVGICQSMLKEGQQRILITRLAKEVAEVVAQELHATGVQDATQDAAHGATQGAMFTYHELCRVGIVGNFPEPNGNGVVVIAAAGTSDLPVAEEAALTAEVLGNQVVRLYDVGVAGIHRLLAHTEDILNASVIVAVAGMEGALPSVVAGMASVPVIAVPTSVGYGASFNGIAALLAMLNSCASGVSVVNIDNGFGAGYQASLINHSKI